MADSVIQAVTGKIMEYSVDALKKQLNYLCFYSSNVQTLADELEDLKIRHESVQQDVDAARANFGVIRPEVEAWLRKVEELKSRSDEIRGDAQEIQRSSVRKWLPLLHYSLSRKAFKTAKDSVKLQNTKFDKIFDHVIPAEIGLVPTQSFGFKSRNLIEDKIIDLLKVSSVYSIGIWGIGGVGKTVMVQKIEKRVRDEKSLFQHVVMVIVSQKSDLRKLQSQIAEALSLRLSEESPALRQRELHQRLKAEKSILIILDDLWECLELEKLGIPSQTTHARCKLILTSRNKNVLNSTGVPHQNLFQLGILTEEESWRFFRDNAGIINLADDDSNNELFQIARKVERECKGLPLALKIVASALKGQDISFWYNALEELKKSAPKNISSVLKDVYQSLKYSFNALESEEQMDLFLLCCLFPEDYSISIEELLRCGVGLRIFKGVKNLTEVRNKVETILNILLSRSLLNKGYKCLGNFEVRVHDVIRDVGIWIATEEGMIESNGEKHLFMISHGLNECSLMTEEDSSNINNCTFISLQFSHPSVTFPKSIVYPKLEFLRLDVVRNVEFPGHFFNGMGELKVLEALNIRLLPLSIGELNSLRTLFLQGCEISETISMLGELTNLEILSLKKCEIEILPLEIGGLKKLKQMNISYCESLRKIVFGVISELTRLEELVIFDSFDKWEAEDGGEKGVACLSELNGLENLTTLKIEIEDPSVVPIEKPLWVQKVKKYGITISRGYLPHVSERYQKSILLGKEVVNPLGDWVYDMASNVECLSLEGAICMSVMKWLSQNFRNLSYLKVLTLSEFTNMLYLVEGLQKGAIFPKLESLTICSCDTLKQISDVSSPVGSFVALEHIYFKKLNCLVCLWNVSVKEQLCLKNLGSIIIKNCDNISYLFSLSVAQSLVQLSLLDVSFCETMKEIFKKDDGELVEKIELPKLWILDLKNLKSFCDFCNEIDSIKLPQLHGLFLSNLPSMKMTKGDNKKVHQQYFIPEVTGKNFNFCGLTDLEVKGIGNFKCMFSPSVVNGIPNLRRLKVNNCSMLEQVIGKDEENVGETISFPNLKHLYLKNLPNILRVCYNSIQMPSLDVLTITECPQMLKFAEEHPNPTPFINNEQVCCPKLRRLFLNKLNISAVFSPATFKSLTNLQFLWVYGCEELGHIIIKEEEGETGYEELTENFSLRLLNLRKLPKLCGSIFEMKHPLEFPSLASIEIEDCPMLEKFSLGSVHLPKWKMIPSPEIHSEKSYFTISIEDISLSSDFPENICWCLLPIDSSLSFINVVRIPLNTKIVGKFKTEKIQTGIEYEIMLMIMWDDPMWVENMSDENMSDEDMSDDDESEGIDPLEIELNIPGESKLQQRKEILQNQARKIWTEISIGKFIMREPQQFNEELEFSLRKVGWRIWVKGVRIVEV